MSKRVYEPELFSNRPDKRKRTDDALAKHILEGLCYCHQLAHTHKHFRRRHGFRPPRPHKFTEKRAIKLLEYLTEQFFPEHHKQWTALAEYSTPAEHDKLMEERVGIAIDFVDWIVQNHFRSLEITNIASEYWMAEYGKALARERVRTAGCGEVADSWEETTPTE